MYALKRRSQARQSPALSRNGLGRKRVKLEGIGSSIRWNARQARQGRAKIDLRQLEAENTELRRQAVELVLDIHDLKARILELTP